MAEELALDKVFGNGGAIDFDEQIIFALAVSMDGQRLQAVHGRQPDVQQDDVETALLQRIQTLFARSCQKNLVAFVFQHALERAPYLRLVIHDEDVAHYAGFPSAWPLRAASMATGNSTMKRVPTGEFSSTRTEPWCSSTMRPTMASPSPVPRFLVEK